MTPFCKHEPPKDDCPICQTYLTNSHFRAKWGNAAPKRTIRPIAPCRFLGDRIRLEMCDSCGGGVQIAVLQCDVHGECTVAKRIGKIETCFGCDFRVPIPSE